jgi:hypothetical protein
VAPVEQRVVGVAVAGAPTELSEALSLSSRTGAALDQLTFYAAWAGGGDFPAADASRIAATGAVPELAWKAWDPAAGVDQPAYALDRITAGAHDAYLKRWATQVRAWGGPVVIRLAHEMNGDWYPWAEGVNTNGPGDHAGGDKAAWIADVWAWLDVHPEVRGVTWFSLLKEADWRTDSSEASLAAWGDGARRF